MNWDKLQILSSVAFAAGGFVLGVLTVQNSRAAVNASKAEIALKIIPLLVDDDPAKRELAAGFATKFDPEFAALIRRAQALRDPDSHVRAEATTSLLRQAEKSTTPIVVAAAASVTLADEIRDKKLLPMLQEAARYGAAGNADGTEKAVRIFRSVVAQISDRSRRPLNFLAAAGRERDPELALRFYQAAFRNYDSLAE